MWVTLFKIRHSLTHLYLCNVNSRIEHHVVVPLTCVYFDLHGYDENLQRKRHFALGFLNSVSVT